MSGSGWDTTRLETAPHPDTNTQVTPAASAADTTDCPAVGAACDACAACVLLGGDREGSNDTRLRTGKSCCPR